jgi:hypothetical protein
MRNALMRKRVFSCGEIEASTASAYPAVEGRLTTSHRANETESAFPTFSRGEMPTASG